jgi:hypothetical protein
MKLNPFSKEKPHQLKKDTPEKIQTLKNNKVRVFDDAEDLSKKGVTLNDYGQMVLEDIKADLNRERISDSKKNKEDTTWNKQNFSRAINNAEGGMEAWEKDVFDIENKIQALNNEFNELDTNPTTDPDELERINERMEEITEERERADKDLAEAKNFVTIKKAEKLGLERMKYAKENPVAIDNVYGEHTGKDGTKSGEQRRKGSAEKSQARINFENALKNVGDLQTQYLTAYESHFKNMSPRKLKLNRMLENLGIRQGDKVKALKTEREKYESAKAGLLENLKNDLMKSRTIERPDGTKLKKEGLHPDQAERVAAKYVEKVLNIESINRENAKLETAKNEAFKDEIAKEQAAAKELENATRMEKIGLYFKRNWKFKVAMLGVGLTTTAVTGGVAGLYLLRRVAGMIGGLAGAEVGKKLGSGAGEALYGEKGHFGAKKFDAITTEYLEGKISTTEYEKRLEKMGLNKKRVKAVLAIAGGFGGGLGLSSVEAHFAGPVHATDVGASLVEKGEVPDETTPETEDGIRQYQPLEVNDVHDGFNEAAHVKHVDQPTTESAHAASMEHSDNIEETTEVVQEKTNSSENAFEYTAKEGDGGIRMVRGMQAILKAKFPDMDSAPQTVQDFVNADAEQLNIDEKILVYKNGVAFSGRIDPGDKLVFDANTNKLEIISAKGDIISTLEDGNATTDEVFTGKMLEEHSNSSAGETTGMTDLEKLDGLNNGTQHVNVIKYYNPEDLMQMSDDTQPLVTDDTNMFTGGEPEIDENGNQVTTTLSNSTETPDSFNFDNSNYDGDIVAMAERYGVNKLPAIAQENFFHDYDNTVRLIFATDANDQRVLDPYESPSLWDTYKTESYKEIVTTLDQKIDTNGMESLSIVELGIYKYLHPVETAETVGKIHILEDISLRSPDMSLRDIIAVVERNS